MTRLQTILDLNIYLYYKIDLHISRAKCCDVYWFTTDNSSHSILCGEEQIQCNNLHELNSMYKLAFTTLQSRITIELRESCHTCRILHELSFNINFHVTRAE